MKQAIAVLAQNQEYANESEVDHIKREDTVEADDEEIDNN